MGKKFVIGVFTAIFLTSFTIFAMAEGELNFKDALSLALQQNPQMMEARKSIDASKGGLITARTLANPEVELEIGGFKKDDDGNKNTRLNTIEVRQSFDPLGVKHLKSKIASNEVKVQQETLKAVWSSVYLKLRETYFQIILHKKELELTQANLNAMHQFFSHVQLRYQSGQALKNDFQRAKIELLQAENDYLAAQKELKTNKAHLNLLLGRPMEDDSEIKEILKEEQLTESFESLKEIALTNRPDIKIADLELDAKQKNLLKEQLSRLPSYYVGFQRTDNDQEKDYAVLVGVQIPFWNLNQGEVKKAKAEKEIQEIKVKTIKNNALLVIYDGYLTAELHQKQLRLFKTSLEESNELFRLANLRYSEGKIDFLNYLDQIRTATKSKVGYYNALFNLSRSISALESSIYGSLRQEDFLNEKF